MVMIEDYLNTVQPLKKVSIRTFWYVLYTRPHHEKKIYELLLKENIDAFLPLHTILKQWSDRKKKVTEPLFSCYMFVNISIKEYYNVLQFPGVIRYVSFEGKAIAISDYQIQLIKNILDQDIEAVEIKDEIPQGSKVQVTNGPLIGLHGVLINHRGKERVVIRLEEIDKSIQVNIPLYYLKVLDH
jgi:transcriptional antiterminator RfaH